MINVLTMSWLDDMGWAAKDPSPRMLRLVSSCYAAAEKFDALERNRLRLTGQLTGWFFDEVERLADRRRA
jgi:hypothetical protein